MSSSPERSTTSSVRKRPAEIALCAERCTPTQYSKRRQHEVVQTEAERSLNHGKEDRHGRDRTEAKRRPRCCDEPDREHDPNERERPAERFHTFPDAPARTVEA